MVCNQSLEDLETLVSRVLRAGAKKNSCTGHPTQHTASIYSKLEDKLILKAVELKGREPTSLASASSVFEKELGVPWRKGRALPKLRHRRQEITR